MVMAQFERGGGAGMYGLILVDYNMPVCSGAETTKMIRDYLEAKVDCQKRPHIVCTANSITMATRNECKKAGADNLVAKPIFKKAMYFLLV